MSEYQHCIKMSGEAWELTLDAPLGLCEKSVYRYLMPNNHLRAELDQLIGKNKWIYQSLFSNDVDQDHMALWFLTAEDELTVRIWLCLQSPY
jgi:hypothetical protein